MLFLKNISLIQFRNYISENIVFNKQIIGICGKNGCGKTNILDAIYYLSFCKSYFNRSDTSNATHQLKGFRISADYLLHNNEVNTTCIVRETGKKEFSFDGNEYKKLSNHIGLLPCVMIAPDDTEIIIGASDLRRKFIDVILAQTEQDYLQNLIDYNNILQQRNSLLKQANKTGLIDDSLLEIINNQLIEKGNFIHQIRVKFLTNFLVLVQKNYEKISLSNEVVTCKYSSQLNESNFKDLLHLTLQNDIYLQRTTSGIHKDDIEFYLDEIKFKTEASQGQRKSLLFALKLSEWEYLKDFKGFSPILLLDDVFEKLDSSRMNNLLQIVIAKTDAQIFITDTHQQRLEQHLSDLKTEFQIISL